MEKLLERYVVYSHKEKSYITYFGSPYRGGCDYTNNIYKAELFENYDSALGSISYSEEDFCEIIKLYKLNEDWSEE